MNKMEHPHHPHGDPNGGSNHPNGRPYWKSAHRDWRLWVCVIVMLAALMVYLTSYESPSRPRGESRQPALAPVGN